MKQIAFTFSLLKFVEWFLDHEGLNAVSDFTDNNNFTPLKLQLLPYFLCTANGNRQAMFSIFDSFYADTEIGYVENDLKNILLLDGALCDVFLIKQNGLEITENGVALFDGIILNSEKFSQKFDLINQFTPNDFIENATSLIEHLDHSVESLKEQDLYKNGGILLVSDDKLSSLSKIHTTYNMYKNGFATYIDVDGHKKIDLKFLIKEMSMFGKNENQRIQTPLFKLFQD